MFVVIALTEALAQFQPLNLTAAIRDTDRSFIRDFRSGPHVDFTADVAQSGLTILGAPEGMEWSGLAYDSVFISVDPLVIGFPRNFNATQFGLLNVSMQPRRVRSALVRLEINKTSVLLEGLYYKYNTCSGPAYTPDSAAVLIEFTPDSIAVSYASIATYSCNEFRIDEGLPGFSRYQVLRTSAKRASATQRTWCTFATDSTFDGTAQTVRYLGCVDPATGLSGKFNHGFPESPVRVTYYDQGPVSTDDPITENEIYNPLVFRDDVVEAYDRRGRNLPITLYDLAGRVIARDRAVVDRASFDGVYIVTVRLEERVWRKLYKL